MMQTVFRLNVPLVLFPLTTVSPVGETIDQSLVEGFKAN